MGHHANTHHANTTATPPPQTNIKLSGMTFFEPIGLN